MKYNEKNIINGGLFFELEKLAERNIYYDFDMNHNINLYALKPKSSIKCYWKCKNKNHSWQAKPNTIFGQTSGCPQCYGRVADDENNLLKTHKDLCLEWDFVLNKNHPTMYKAGSNAKVWWICGKCQFSYNLNIAKRALRGDGCGSCSNRIVSNKNNLLVKFPKICMDWDYSLNKSHPKDFVFGSTQKVWWLCNFGHSYYTKIRNRTVRLSGCPQCNSKSSVIGNKWLDYLSIKEREKWFFFDSIKIRVDGYDPINKIIYEFNGDYWHGNPNSKFTGNKINKNCNKTFAELYQQTILRQELLKNNGYRVVCIWEKDYLDILKCKNEEQITKKIIENAMKQL